jgi:predicted 2-oxoglutarate/Fe(II)-dependent dioxygenase YbiX
MKNKLEDYVFKIKNFLNKDLCKQITKQLINVKWKDHYFSNYGRQYKRSGNKELKVSHDQIVNQKEIMNRLHSAIKQYQNNFNFLWFSSWAGYTAIRFNKYSQDKVMAKHCDHIHDIFDGEKKGIPILSCLGALNDNYKGGEFILFDNKQVELKAGELLIFPSNFMYPHEIKPVTKGTRYSYISWVY